MNQKDGSFIAVFTDATLCVSVENGKVRTEFFRGKPHVHNTTLPIPKDAENEETKMSEEELLKLSNEEKYELIRAGKHLDVFIEDEYWKVRRDVAEQGYGLEKLVNDESWRVRYIATEMLEKAEESEENNE